MKRCWKLKLIHRIDRLFPWFFVGARSKHIWKCEVCRSVTIAKERI